MIKEMFKCFETINRKLDNNIAEISLKQTQMSITFEDQTVVSAKDLRQLDDTIEPQFSITNVMTFNECLYVIFSDLQEKLINKVTVEPYSFLYSFIFDLKDLLCACPALEYVISSNYIKVYLDLPNLHIKDLVEVDKKLQSEGILELSMQRPYLLYVKDW